MKIETRKHFILNQREKTIVDEYIKYLARNPLPCSSCPAQASGKCEGYTIFSVEPKDDEECKVCREYLEDNNGLAYRRACSIIEDEDLKTVILNRYYLELAKKNAEDTNTAVKVMQYKVDLSNKQIEYEPIKFHGGEVLFEIETDEEGTE